MKICCRSTWEDIYPIHLNKASPCQNQTASKNSQAIAGEFFNADRIVTGIASEKWSESAILLNRLDKPAIKGRKCDKPIK